MNNVLEIASGIVLGQFIWFIILTIMLFIVFKLIIRAIKRKIFNIGFELSVRGTGFIKKFNTKAIINRNSIKNFIGYSKRMTTSIFDRIQE